MSYDSDAAVYFTAVESADVQSLETGVKDAINAFVVGCKSDGIWSAIKAACIMAGARTLNGALVPLVGAAPTNFNFVSGDYNRETGLLGNGSTKYLNSNYAFSSGNQNNSHISVWRTQAEGSVVVEGLIGNSSSSDNSQLTTTSTQRIYRVNSSGGAVTDSSRTLGFAGASRSISTSLNYRYAGSTSTVSTTSFTPSTTNFTVFARNAFNHTNARMSWYSIGESLDLALLDARLSALMTALANPATYGVQSRRRRFSSGGSGL